MAASPPHRLGQIIGDFLEELIEPLLEDFCQKHGQNSIESGLFLDKKGERSARSGKKLTWEDKQGNSHDLDFVIERGGSNDKIGCPVAFIEVAWRRYTKHSKNKVQEIQAAIMPIVEMYSSDPPFLGIFLAGFFTKPAIRQLESLGFTVSFFPYRTFVEAFSTVGINIESNDKTSDEHSSRIADKIKNLSLEARSQVKNRLISLNREQLGPFFAALEKALIKGIVRLVLTPLYGEAREFKTPFELADFVTKYKSVETNLPFAKYEIYVQYTNGSEIRSNFQEKGEILDFLEYISKSVAVPK